MSRFTAPLTAAALQLSGCESNIAWFGPGDPWLNVECEFVDCTKQMIVASADLIDCYDYDLQSNPPTGWPTGTPQEIIDSCTPPPSGDCVIDLYTGSVQLNNVCGCEFESEFGDGCDCCTHPTSDQTEENEDWVAAGEEILLDLAGCNASLLFNIDCPEPEGDCGEQSGDCPEDKPISAIGADIHLEINPLLSFIDFGHNQYSDQVALSGNGAANINPDGFMRGAAWVDDAQLGSMDFENWMIWFDHPIAMDLSGGEFEVEPDEDPVCMGSGTIDTAEAVLSVVMSESAVGEFDDQTMAWSIDYYELAGNDYVDIHLEGAFEWLE